MSKKSSAAAREERRTTVAANLLAGTDYRTMAGALGVSVGTIANDVKIMVNRWQKEQVADIDDWINLSDRRLERAIKGVWPGVQKGDTRAVTALIRIIETQMKLRQVADLNVNIHADWRKELEAVNDGADAGEVFEQIVQTFFEAIQSGAGVDAP